jgi:hypothetical protein
MPGKLLHVCCDQMIKYIIQNTVLVCVANICNSNIEISRTCYIRTVERLGIETYTRCYATSKDCAVAQVVSCRLLCGIYGGQKALGQVFFKYSDFPCQAFHRLLQSNPKKLHGLSPQANYTDQVTTACRRS